LFYLVYSEEKAQTADTIPIRHSPTPKVSIREFFRPARVGGKDLNILLWLL